ncbi:hypothetical protein PYCCODRAFT_1367286 [Trametes coccinea BRFM310]|uniref:Uncharacterized protein n=1 Tax=Trametes coccinea (strain BRFM310) TaxID=1353009 RepID=A0A1Y2IN66_TRAC3|nr:hypothetical protein PYCCODRAFT_1367286 [Trametes coccinea BRFM310]
MFFCRFLTRLAGGYEHLYQAARLLPRIVGAYVDYNTVMSKGLANYGTYSSDDPDYLERVFNEYWEVRFYFRKINKAFPGLTDHHRYLCEDADLVTKMAKFMSTIAAKARSDDAGRVRRYIYEIAGWTDEALKTKCERGFNHIVTGRLLCPVTQLDTFDEDPQDFCRGVRDLRDKRFWVTGDDWPMFLYDMDEHSPGDITAGLFRSELLLKATSTGRKKPKGKPPVLNRFDNPTGTFTIYAIIYVACLVRHALNTHADWTDDDGDFCGLKFVRTLLTLTIRNIDWQDKLTCWYKRY